MSPYNFVPYINGKGFLYDCALTCVNCKNLSEAIFFARRLKERYLYDFVSVSKHVTHV